MRGPKIWRFRNTVDVDVDAVNCHIHGRTNFRPRVDRVFTTHPGRLTRRDADVPVHVFLTLIFEFFDTSMRLHASCVCVRCDSNVVLMQNLASGLWTRSGHIDVDVDRVAKPRNVCNANAWSFNTPYCSI